jgi:hypothetical protein
MEYKIMKKLFLLCMSLVILFSNCCSFLANPKGDPLIGRDEYVELLRQCFEHTEIIMKDPNYPCVWEKKPNFWFWDSDYRTVRVYNIPLLIRTKREEGFLRDSCRIFLKAREISENNFKLGKLAGKQVIKLFADRLKSELKGSKEIASIAKFLGTDDNVAMDCFVLTFGMICASRVLHGISIIAGFLDSFGVISLFGGPAGLTLAIALDIACFTTTKSALAQEKMMNYATVLGTIYAMLLDSEEQDHILKSNVLVSAVDERKFTPFLRWNAFRRNDGGWCDFVHIGGLKCAPNAKDYDGGKVIPILSEIYNRILRKNEQLDLEEMEKFVNTGVIHVDHFFSEKKEETSKLTSSPSSSSASNKSEDIV